MISIWKPDHPKAQYGQTISYDSQMPWLCVDKGAALHPRKDLIGVGKLDWLRSATWGPLVVPSTMPHSNRFESGKLCVLEVQVRTPGDNDGTASFKYLTISI